MNAYTLIMLLALVCSVHSVAIVVLFLALRRLRRKKALTAEVKTDDDVLDEWEEEMHRHPLGSPKHTAYKNRLAEHGR
jgi:uncharacterized membrane-anchored protein YhcB (DUF1043 family)